MSLINTVRATVLSIANKNNFGYITPADFNLYAKQAQLDIFEDYFYQYNSQIVKQNARVSGSGYADIVKGIEEVIDTFTVFAPLSKNVVSYPSSLYLLPNQEKNGSDYYIINKILVYQKQKTSGTNTQIQGGQNRLIDSSADFFASGVVLGDIVSYRINGITYNQKVTAINSSTQLTIDANNLSNINIDYIIYDYSKLKEAEKVTHSKITMLSNSMLTKPTLSYPAYTQNSLDAQIYPDTITDIGQVTSQYIRYHKNPNWTSFNIITGGEPSFDETALDYQDFELPLSDETNIINKILQYAGMSIREAALVQFGKAEEKEATTQEG